MLRLILGHWHDLRVARCIEYLRIYEVAELQRSEVLLEHLEKFLAVAVIGEVGYSLC